MCRVLQVKRQCYLCTRLIGFDMAIKNPYNIKICVTYIKSTVKNWSCVLVLHSHGVASNIIETDSAVPGGDQQELGCAGAELDSRDAVLWPLVQLVLI